MKKTLIQAAGWVMISPAIAAVLWFAWYCRDVLIFIGGFAIATWILMILFCLGLQFITKPENPFDE